MAKALKSVAIIAAVAIGNVVGGPIGGLIAATITAGVLAATAKSPQVSAASSDRLTANIELRTPRKIVFGSTAMATDIRDQEFTDDQTYLHRWIVVASHVVHAIREIWFDDKLAWTLAGGAQGDFAPWLQITPVLEGSAANAINVSARMGSSRRYTGCAYVYLRYTILAHSKKLDSVFNSSIPTRITIIGDGAPTYDPRLDSTVPGGAGTMRADDQSTWVWNDDASRNPAIATLFYLLGWRINGKLAVGKGVPAARLDLASFITAANLCDEPVAKSAGGTEPRYRCDGIFSEGDATSLVLDNLKAAANADLDDMDGRIRMTVRHNDLAAPIGELTTGDVLGAFTWAQTPALSESFNIVRGGYTDPSTTSLYQLVDYPEVAIDSPDGIDRAQTLNLSLVQSASQAQRLAKQRLQRTLYAGTFSATFQATAWKYQKGDVVRFTWAPLGWYQKLFRIEDTTIQVDGTVPMTLREEAPAIYAWDASDAAPVVGVAPTSYDPSLWPIVQGLADVDTRVGLVLSDDVITAGREKREIIAAWRAVESQLNAVEGRYQALGAPADVTTVRNAAQAAFSDSAAILLSLTPAWDAVDQDTPVDGAALNASLITLRDKVAIFAAAIQGRPGSDGANGADGEDGSDGAPALTLTANASSLAFLADAFGNLKSGQLAQAVKYTARSGGTDVSATATFSIDTSGCSAAVDADGLVTFSALTASGYVRVSATYGGTTLPAVLVPTNLARDPAPPTTDTTASTGVSASGLTSSSYPSVPDATTVVTVTGGVLHGVLYVEYQPADRGNFTAEAVLGYRLSGTTYAWTYFSGGAVQGSLGRIGGTTSEPIFDIGSVGIDQTQSVSNARYDVGAFLRRYSGGQPGECSGSLQVKDG